MDSRRRLTRADGARRWAATVGSLVALTAVGMGIAPADAADSLATARNLLWTGKYAEAGEMYGRLAEKEPVAATVGAARALLAVGQGDRAEKALRAAIDKHPAAATLVAELATLKFDQGDYPTAAKLVEAALKLDRRQLAARWVRAELDRTAGRHDAALAGYKWFVDYYNATDKFTDPETLGCIGRAAAQYARWKRLDDQFDFLVNELYPDALDLDQNYWPAHLAAGQLFSEKYNFAEAQRAFDAALAIDPQAAEIHAARGALALEQFDLAKAKLAIDRALEINPRLAWAHRLRADWWLSNCRPAEALAALETAAALNPLDDETLGRMAAVFGAVDGSLAADAGTRIRKLIDQVGERNPNAGEFHAALATALDRMRRYPDAAAYYEQALKKMPRLIDVGGRLGMVYMRLGDEAKAAPLLARSFQDDPFNVRVKNSLEVLDVLAGYATIETDHFLLRFDRGRDEILARCAARFLERDVYPDLTGKLGFAPPEKTLIELFSRAKNTDGHGWFSARMVGLPYVGAVAACAGKMVAMQSPNDAPASFDWARVLRHEFVHVINLQQTGFRIPHWYTEALAVQNEGGPRPWAWKELLRSRATNEKQLFNLDTIHLGFIRPKSSDDWQMAYCQADLYAEYLTRTYGAGATGKLLRAYGDNLDTPAALRREFGVEQAALEKAYRAFLVQVAQKQAGNREPPAVEAAAVAESLKKNPHDVRALARWAELRPDDAAVRKKLAEVSLAAKDFAVAADWANQSIHIDVMDGDVHRTLGQALVEIKQNERAAEHFRFALQIDPSDKEARAALAKLDDRPRTKPTPRNPSEKKSR